jgi:hypothetical protein
MVIHKEVFTMMTGLLPKGFFAESEDMALSSMPPPPKRLRPKSAPAAFTNVYEEMQRRNQQMLAMKILSSLAKEVDRKRQLERSKSKMNFWRLLPIMTSMRP